MLLNTTTVLIVDDHELIRRGLATFLDLTDDVEVAVQEGSTQIRVGTALFGPRPTP